MFYVYIYSDPRNQLPFYVGKGKDGRDERHMVETYENTENKKKWAVIQGLRNKGLSPLITRISTHSVEVEAYEAEEALIRKYGRRDLDPGGILTNICLSNRPPNPWADPTTRAARIEQRRAQRLGRKHTVETKDKCRQANLGKVVSDETKRRMSQSADHRGEKNPNFGRKCSEATKQKLREARLRNSTKYRSAEYRDKQRQVQTARWSARKAIQQEYGL